MNYNSDDIQKLQNMNIGEFLNEDEKSQLSEIFNQVGMKDWILDTRDNSVKLQVKYINKSNNPEPSYQKEGDSGFDFRAFITDPITIEPFKRLLVPTGLYFQIPVGFELQVRPRSGLALKHGITVLNTPGTVDAGYRGEVGVLLINLGDEPFVINSGDRIAQGVIAPVQTIKTTMFTRSNRLDESDRGTGGFGSTGKQ